MARAMRIEYAGAVYHFMERGNQGQAILADDLDRQTWIRTLGQACEKTGWRICAWVLATTTDLAQRGFEGRNRRTNQTTGGRPRNPGGGANGAVAAPIAIWPG
jgi:hypothetical protein